MLNYNIPSNKIQTGAFRIKQNLFGKTNNLGKL